MSGYIKNCDCNTNHNNHNMNSDDECTMNTDSMPKKILLECGQNLESAIFDVMATGEQTFTLGRIIVDTSCLREPEVKIEFSSIVFFESDVTPSTGTAISLTFTVFRSCNNEAPVEVFTRMYTKDFLITQGVVDEVISSETFSFTFCEFLDGPKCCEYIVEVSADADTDFQNLKTAEVNNLSLGAFAQGIGRDCDCD